jgi:MFS family permease
MVIPDMPLVLEKLGGREYIWLIIPSFASIALIMRPLSGKMTDINGRVFVMILGAVITTLSGILYLFVPIVSLLFAVRAFHGISAGFTPTGFTAYADDIVPLYKRGEAMGIIGICNNIGNAMGWVLGSQVTQSFGIETMFYVSSFLGLISVVMFSFLKESIQNKQKLNINLLKFNRHDLIEKRVLFPSLIFLMVCFTSGTILALIGDFSAFLKIEKQRALHGSIYQCFTIYSIHGWQME